jgi:hypothetical protein
MIEDFFHLPLVVHLELRNGPNGTLKELIHEKTRSQKSRDTVPLKTLGACSECPL